MPDERELKRLARKIMRLWEKYQAEKENNG